VERSGDNLLISLEWVLGNGRIEPKRQNKRGGRSARGTIGSVHPGKSPSAA